MKVSFLPSPRVAGERVAHIERKRNACRVRGIIRISARGEWPLTRLARCRLLGTLSPQGRGEGKHYYFIACGLSGEPVPPVMTSGGPQKKNS